MSNNVAQDAKRVVTGQVRLSYAHLLIPRTPQQGGTPKYSVTLLIPKSDVATYQKIQTAIQAAANEAVTNKWGGTKPAQLAAPIHDGDGLKQSGEPFPIECKGHWIITASSEQKPEIVDINLNPILDATQVYSGMYARVSIRFFGYFNSGKKGVGAGLGNVQKVADGEPLSGNVSADKDFGVDAAPWNPPTQAPKQAYPQPAYPQYQQPAYPQQGYQAPQAAYPQPVYPQAPQQGYSQPAYPQYPQQPYQGQLDPITGKPVGGVMGL